MNTTRTLPPNKRLTNILLSELCDHQKEIFNNGIKTNSISLPVLKSVCPYAIWHLSSGVDIQGSLFFTLWLGYAAVRLRAVLSAAVLLMRRCHCVVSIRSCLMFYMTNKVLLAGP